MNPQPVFPSGVIRSRRRSMALEIRPTGEVWLRIPIMSAWLRRRPCGPPPGVDQRPEKLAQRPPVRQLNSEEIALLYERARAVLPAKLEKACGLLGVAHRGLRITGAEKRFGSCSSKGRICFSYQLMRYPEAAVDYVVLHEAAHLKYLSHGKAFYALIEAHMPDYKARRALLRQPPGA